jgi:general stress protein YciG
MSGTREGGLKAAATNKRRYGDGKNGTENFYTNIGRKGGLISRGGYFSKDYIDPATGKTGQELAMEAGRKGGKAPRRTKAVK